MSSEEETKRFAASLFSDAIRYRWLREQAEIDHIGELWPDISSPQERDDFIDELMKKDTRRNNNG